MGIDRGSGYPMGVDWGALGCSGGHMGVDWGALRAPYGGDCDAATPPTSSTGGPLWLMTFRPFKPWGLWEILGDALVEAEPRTIIFEEQS